MTKQSESKPAATPQPNTYERLLRDVRRAGTVERKLRLMDVCGESEPDALVDVACALAHTKPAELMGDDDLKLLRAWAEHRPSRSIESLAMQLEIHSSTLTRLSRRLTGLPCREFLGKARGEVWRIVEHQMFGGGGNLSETA